VIFRFKATANFPNKSTQHLMSRTEAAVFYKRRIKDYWCRDQKPRFYFLPQMGDDIIDRADTLVVSKPATFVMFLFYLGAIYKGYLAAFLCRGSSNPPRLFHPPTFRYT
jgi:hypothetical protein